MALENIEESKKPEKIKSTKAKKISKLSDGNTENKIHIDISDKKKSERVEQSFHSIQSKFTYSSPLPPAELLEHYNHVLPDGANKAYNLIAQEQNFRHTMNYEQHAAVIKDMENEHIINIEKLNIERKGQGSAMTLSIFTFITVIILGLTNHDSLAGGVATLGLGTLAIAMLKGKNYSSKDSIEANKINNKQNL